jgi:predicted DNA-binding ribbon-helix-helix protein
VSLLIHPNVSERSSDRGVMSRTIEIPDEVYAQLEQQASRRGVTLPQIIAELVHADEQARMAAAIERLRTQGVLLTPSSSAQPAATDVAPLQVQGKPLSEVIIEERR